MVRKHKSHMPVVRDTAGPPPYRPKYMAKQEFAKRLYALMMERGWSQADLHRAASKGGEPQVSRDDVSRYIRGASLPVEGKLRKLASTLNVQVEDLLPNYVAGAIENEEHPVAQMTSHPTDQSLAWLTVNRLTRATTAAKIMALLMEDDVTSVARKK